MSSRPAAADAPPSYLHQDNAFSPPYTQHGFASEADTASADSCGKPPILQPWLGLRARLLLAPISIPLISLLFVATRLLMSSNDASDSVTSAKTKVLSACDAAEHTASLAASFPHFLAATTNVQLAQTVTATVHGAARVFDLSMTAIEKILTYIVNSYKSLLLCFMELLVRGALAVLIEAVQLISQAITAAAQAIRAAIQDSISGVNAILSTAVGAINDVVGVFGQHVEAPHIAVPSLAALDNITLPHEIQDGLLKLNATLPTLQQLKQTMDALIETPFEEMKREVNATLGAFQFNHSVFALPPMQNVTFCDRIDTRPLDELGDAMRGVARWGLVVLLLVAMVVMLIGVGWEWYKWQREVKAVERTRGVWLSQHPSICSDDLLKTRNLMSLITISRHPAVSHFSLKFCQRTGIRTRRAQDRFAWLFSFVTHPASLACIFTGVLGLISVSLQTVLIHRLARHYNGSISTSLTHLSADIVDLVNDHTRNASLAFSSSANTVILQVEAELNDHVFRWVDTTTSTMNATLNQFVDGITDTLTSTFGGTPFNAPLQTFVQCILGQKVQGIEKALTWIHDNAHVNFSMVPADVLMLKPEQQEAVLRPVRQAMLGNGDAEDEGSGVVGHVISRYLKRLRQEKIMFAVLVAIWVAIFSIGLLVVAYATIVERRGGPDEGGAEEKQGHEETEEKLRSDLQADPGAAARLWWSRMPRPTIRRFKAMSPASMQPVHPAIQPKQGNIAPGRTSLANSSRSNRTHVAKDSISYPFQIHHSLNTTSHRPQQPTPLRQAASNDRDTVLSLSTASALPTTAVAATANGVEQRDSWLSFLASHARDEAADPAHEGAQDRFQRLFGCSPVASPTVASFNHHVSAPVLSREGEGGKDSRFRETLDLRPIQDWMGSKSPIPPPIAGNTTTDSRVSEAELTRSQPQEKDIMVAAGARYAFSTAAGSLSRQHQQQQQQQQQQQKLAASPQSITFYAW